MSTIPCCFATSRIRVTVGPSSGSAVAYHFGSCSAQKYGPWKISWRHVTSAPSAAAFAISSTCLSIASSFGMLACAWITAALTVIVLSHRSRYGLDLGLVSLLAASGAERRKHVLPEPVD